MENKFIEITSSDGKEKSLLNISHIFRIEKEEDGGCKISIITKGYNNDPYQVEYCKESYDWIREQVEAIQENNVID